MLLSHNYIIVTSELLFPVTETTSKYIYIAIATYCMVQKFDGNFDESGL